MEADIQLKVSEIPIYLTCPKKLYLHYQGTQVAPKSEQLLDNLFYKELSYQISEIDVTEEMIELLLDDISVIYRERTGSIEPEVFNAFRERIISCSEQIMAIAERIRSFYVDMVVDSIEIGRFLSSKRFSLSGSPDKVLEHSDGVTTPVIIKTGRIPENGIWKDDRMRVTAYAILLEDDTGDVIDTGFVEYIREGEVRVVKIRESDRRHVLKVLKMMRRIKGGVIPDRLDSELCETCLLQDKCLSERSLLSRFF